MLCASECLTFDESEKLCKFGTRLTLLFLRSLPVNNDGVIESGDSPLNIRKRAAPELRIIFNPNCFRNSLAGCRLIGMAVY